MEFSFEFCLLLNYFSKIYNLCEIIKELSFVFARKPLSKNKETRAHDVSTWCICYEILQLYACSFMHNQCLSKPLKKLKRNQAVKFKFQMGIKTLSF